MASCCVKKHKSIIMKKKYKYLKALGTSIVCTIVAAIVVIVIQTFTNNAVEKKLVDKLLVDIPEQLNSESELRRKKIEEYDQLFQRDLATVKFVMETDGLTNFFDKLNNEHLATTVYLVNRKGKIINGTDDGCIGKPLREVCDLTPEEYSLIVDPSAKQRKSETYVNTSIKKSADGTLMKVFATNLGKNRLVMPAVLKGKYASVYSLDNLSSIFGYVDERLMVVPIDNKTLKFGTFNIDVQDFSNQPISVINLDASITRKPSFGHSEALGYGYTYKTVQYKSDIFGDITILAFYIDEGAVPVEPLSILLATILIVTFLLQLYSFYIDEEPGKLQIRMSGMRNIAKTNWMIDTEKTRILLPFSLVCIVVVTAAGFYLNSFNMVANESWISRWNILSVSDNLGKIDKKFHNDADAVTEDIAGFLSITASVLEEKQHSLLTCNDELRLKRIRQKDGSINIVEVRNPWLSELANVEEACDISVLDDEGKLLITSGTQRNIAFSRKDSVTALAFDVIDGIAESRQFVDGDYVVFCVPFVLRRDGVTNDVMLVSRFDKNAIEVNSVKESITSAFDAASDAGNCHYVMATANEEKRLVYVANILSAETENIPEEAYKDGYLGFQSVKGENYLVATKRVSGAKGDYFIMSFVPCDKVYDGRATCVATTFGTTVFIILILLVVLLIYKPKTVDELKLDMEKDLEMRKKMTLMQLEKLNVAIAKAPTASQRILETIGKIWILILFLMVLVLLKGIFGYSETSLSGYLMSFNWQRSVNIFSISTMIVVTLSFSFVIFILSKLMSVLSNALNANVETACQLMVSLLRYAGYIAVLFTTLYMFGVDTTGVLASLGAFSVMVGLGAQNLIRDVLAGISIIMEKDYKVGDIVDIGGFCGKVNEIGIRTTKVEDIDGDVKIFYNSAISGVVNKTSRLSAVRLDVKLDAQHSFVQVEQMFAKFFERIVGKYPQIKDDCKYLGVQDSTPGFNVFRFSVPCEEIDRVPLRRVLIKEFSEFCKEENISKL